MFQTTNQIQIYIYIYALAINMHMDITHENKYIWQCVKTLYPW